MPFSDHQKFQLMTIRRGAAGTGGVLVLAGILMVYFTIPGTLPWYCGWLVLGGGLLTLMFTAAVCLFPGYLCPQEPEEKPRIDTRAA